MVPARSKPPHPSSLVMPITPAKCTHVSLTCYGLNQRWVIKESVPYGSIAPIRMTCGCLCGSTLLALPTECTCGENGYTWTIGWLALQRRATYIFLHLSLIH